MSSESKLRKRLNERDQKIIKLQEENEKLRNGSLSYVEMLQRLLGLEPHEPPAQWLAERGSKMGCSSCEEVFICDVIAEPEVCPFCQKAELDDLNPYTALVRRERAARKERLADVGNI